MYFPSALLAGAWALGASAFLIPLEISNAAQAAKAESASLVSSSPVTVDVECPDCPFFPDSNNIAHVQTGVETQIHFEIRVDPKIGLTVNGFPIQMGRFPQAEAAKYTPTASLIRVSDGQKTQPLSIAFGVGRTQPITSKDTPGLALVSYQFSIASLEGHPVTAPGVVIQVLENAETTMIVKTWVKPSQIIVAAVSLTCESKSGWSICSLREITAARLRAMLEAANARANGIKGWVQGQGRGCRGRFGLAGASRRPGMHHGHHSGHHHHYAHRYGRILSQTLRFFVIPALLGVIGGLVASAIGMLVGQCIVFLWIRYHRGGRRGNSRTRVVEIVVEEDEKDLLMESEEDFIPPPEYKDEDLESTAALTEEKPQGQQSQDDQKQ